MLIFIENIQLMKKIIINESQKRRIFEAYREGFSFDELTAIADEAFGKEDNSVPQMAYCRKWLGEPVSMGSSRCVFTLSDNIILKLAYGRKYQAGIDQNMMEYEIFERTKSPLLARVYDCDDNYTYLVCENVVPATDEDFEMVVGIPFYSHYHQNSTQQEDPASRHGGDRKIGFNEYFGDDIKQPIELYEGGACLTEIFSYIEEVDVLNSYYYDEKIEDIINNNEWLTELRRLVRECKFGDFSSNIGNFGLVNRYGQPNIVILDPGLTIGVFKKHYTSF